MALYTLKNEQDVLASLSGYNGNSNFVRNQLASLGYAPSASQTQVYNAIGRTAGQQAGDGSSDNFFVKRGKSIENALGTTGAAIASLINDRVQNDKTEQMIDRQKNSINDIYKKYGYNDADAYYNAKDAAENEVFSKYGFNAQDFWDKRAAADLAGDKKLVAQLEAERQSIKDKMTADDANKINYFDNIQEELKGQTKANVEEANKNAADYRDYRENNYISQKINQDRGKFAGSAINTLSTAADLTGLTANPLANAVQGGLEGVADELEQNGLENFDLQRAGQNALIGATTGAVVGALNKGISNSLAKRGGNLFKGGNALTRGLNDLGSKTALGRGAATIATGAGRGAVSGAVGGGTGAGLSAAMNGQDVLGSALQGAKQGLTQGAISGATMAGANMAISKTPGIGDFYNELQNAKTNWDQSGSNFNERLTNTLNSGDSAVGNWLNNRSQSKLLGSVGNIGNSIADTSMPESVKEYMRVRDEKQGIPPDAPAGRIVDEKYREALNDLTNNYSDEALVNIMRSTDDPEIRSLASYALSDRGVDTSTPTTAKGWLKKAGERIVEDANNRGVGLGIKDVGEVDAWDRLAQQKGYNSYDEVIQNYLAANPGVELNPNGAAGQILGWLDENPNTPTTASGWLKKAGQRVVEDTSNRGVGLGIKDVSDELPDDIRNMKINKWKETPTSSDLSLSERIKNNLRTSDGKTASLLKNMPGKLGDKYNDWLAEPAQVEEFGPRYSQFSGDAEAARDYLMRRQQGEVPRASYNQSLQDLNGDGFVDYAYGTPGEGAEYSGGKALSHIQAKHGDDALSRVPYNTENGTIEKIQDDRIYLKNDNNNDRTVIRTDWRDNNTGEVIKKQWLATNYDKNSPASRGATVSGSPTAGSSVVSDTGDAPVTSIIPQNNKNVNTKNAQTEVYRALTGQAEDLSDIFEPEARNIIERQNKFQSLGKQLQSAAKTQKYSALYDSLDAKTAQRAIETNAPDVLADMGVKPENYLEAAKTSNYINGVVSDLAEKSGVKVVSPDLVQKLESAADNAIFTTPNAEKKFTTAIRQIVADGSTPDEYSAGYLLEKSRDFSNKAAKLSGNSDDVKALRTAYNNVKWTLRNEANKALADANITSDVANENIAKGLTKMNAGQKVVDYYTAPNEDGSAPTAADYISRSAYFEQARDMGNQVAAEKLTRSASKQPTNMLTRMWRASGLEQPVNLLLSNTVAPAASLLTKGAGKAIESIGNAAARISGDNVPTATVDTTPTVNTVVDTAYNPSTQIYNAIGRTEGLTNAEQARTANYLVDAAQEAQVVPTTTATMTGSTDLYNTMTGTNSNVPTYNSVEEERAVYFFPPTGDYWSDMLSRAMRRAKNAEDYDALEQLYKMYQSAITETEKSSTSSSEVKLTDKQRQANAAERALNDFEQAQHNFGYDVSDIPVIGNIANFGGNEYASKAEALALQIGYMLSGATVNKEEAKNIGMAYVPQPRDNEATRRSKLAQLRGIISDYQQVYAE